MGHDWIIGVLTDLRSFASQNNLPLLTAQLEEAALVASVEISQAGGQAQKMADPAITARLAEGQQGNGRG